MKKSYSVSVIIPCKDEADNIAQAIQAVPPIGAFTEIVVVDDGSTDGTAEIVKNLKLKIENLQLISYQPNKGKAYAVTAGFKAARGDIVMIWDADMTVPAEELKKFYSPIAQGKADFTNGTRFTYAMQKGAMKLINYIGNKLMGLVFSWVLGQRVTDTLCGTKALLKKDWQKIPMDLDPWGDFSLLIGASKNGLRIMDVPVHYRARVAGKSKMKAIKHGLILLTSAMRGIMELKFKRLPSTTSSNRLETTISLKDNRKQ